MQAPQTPELLGILAAPRVIRDPIRLIEATGIRIAAAAEGIAGILVG